MRIMIKGSVWKNTEDEILIFFFLGGLCLFSCVVDSHGSRCNRSRSFCHNVGKSEFNADRNHRGGGARSSGGGGRRSGDSD